VLKGIDPLITPELIKLLMEMGHDDAIVVADANFTAMSLGAGKTVVRLPGTRLVQVVRAIDSVMPLASDVTHPVAFMQVSDTKAPYLSGLQRDVLGLLQTSLLPHQTPESVERYAFYERTRAACAIVVTGELQPFGNFILRKGAIGENLRP
jgi:L-fucose mutarotase